MSNAIKVCKSEDFGPPDNTASVNV